MGSHASALRRQGVDQGLVDAIGTDNFKNVIVTPKDMALLRFVKILTLDPSHTRDVDVETMRWAGWTDEQIWEAALETSFFAFFNRMADAHGLDYPVSGWFPPELREKLEKERQKLGTEPNSSKR